MAIREEEYNTVVTHIRTFKVCDSCKTVEFEALDCNLPLPDGWAAMRLKESTYRSTDYILCPACVKAILRFVA